MDNDEIVVPFRYGIVNSGLYRGAYPNIYNLRFLRRLKLRTIVSLTPEKPSPDIALFCEILDITLIHIQIQRSATLNAGLHTLLMKAINVCINAENAPLYVHCLDGRRITSLLVLVLRRMQMYSPQAAFAEYWRFQMIGRAPISTQDIERSSKELEKYMSSIDLSEVVVPDTVALWLCGGNRAMLVVGLRGVGSVSKPIAPVPSPAIDENTLKLRSFSSTPAPILPMTTITNAAMSKPSTAATPSKMIAGLMLHGLDIPSSKSSKKKAAAASKLS